MLRKSFLVLALFAAAGLGAWQLMAADTKDGNLEKEAVRTEETIHQAEEVLKAAVNAPDKGIPKELLERAECIGVFPGVKKGAFVIGGEWGRGVFTCRKEEGTMGAPALFTMGGGSVGWQFGGKKVDVVLLVMNKDGLRHLLQDGAHPRVFRERL